MGDGDGLANASDEIASSDQLPDTADDNVDAEAAKLEVSETEIPATEDSMSTEDDSSAIENGVTQAEVYDNLKRIGELEDEKRSIQEEIWSAPSNCVRWSSILIKPASCTRYWDRPCRTLLQGARPQAVRKGRPPRAH